MQRFVILLILNLSVLTVSAQIKDVDMMLKQALHESNVTKDYAKAMALAKQALVLSPDYTDVRLLVGRLYKLTGQPDSARIAFNLVLEQSPGHPDAIAHLKNLDNDTYQQKIANLANSVSITYNPTFFEVPGKQSWDLLSIHYARKTKFGTLIGRINYADRSYNDGFQFELEAYPKHNKGYSFVNLAYSNAAIFPRYRAAYSYLRSFEGGWEGELGLRYQYRNEDFFSYGGSAGKYLGNYWLNLKAYFTPASGMVSQSYTLTSRYYFATADDYLTAIVGTGTSPDDRIRSFDFAERLNTSSLRFGLGYQRLVWLRNVVGILATYNREEHVACRKENEFDIAITFQHRF